MFSETNLRHFQRNGTIEVICGSMFSGKTEELIRRIKRAQFAKQRIEIFKPALDTRYDKTEVVSHNHNSITSTPVESASQILFLASNVDVVGIDEVQFFDPEIINVCNELADQGIRVIVAGLDMDYKGQPFGPMPQLMAIAEQVTKVNAICVSCGDLARNSFRKTYSENLVVLGETDIYIALCRTCFNHERQKPKER